MPSRVPAHGREYYEDIGPDLRGLGWKFGGVADRNRIDHLIYVRIQHGKHVDKVTVPKGTLDRYQAIIRMQDRSASEIG